MTKRLENGSFLEAAITTAFLIAAADGAASESEYDALLDRLEILGGIDRDRIDELLTSVSNDVEANGFEPRLERLTELLTQKDAAQAAVMLGVAIALSDDDFSADERELVVKVCDAIGLGGLDLDAMVTEIRG